MAAAQPRRAGAGAARAFTRLVNSSVEEDLLCAVATGGGFGFASNHDIFFMYSFPFVMLLGLLAFGGFCSGTAVPFRSATTSCLAPPNHRPQQALGEGVATKPPEKSETDSTKSQGTRRTYGPSMLTKESSVCWSWCYWISPIIYAQIAISVYEFHGRSCCKSFFFHHHEQDQISGVVSVERYNK